MLSCLHCVTFCSDSCSYHLLLRTQYGNSVYQPDIIWKDIEFKIQAKGDIELYNIYDFVTKCKEIWTLEGAWTWKYLGLNTWVMYLGTSCKSCVLGLNAILHGVAQPHCYTKTTITSTMVLLKEITTALEPYPDLHDSLPFLDAEQFIWFAVWVKGEIQLNQPATATGPPLCLPIYIHEFLRDVLTFQDLDTLQCWSAFQHIIWCSELTADLLILEAALFERIRSRSSQANEQIGEW